MVDPLHIEHHPEEEHSLHELRSEFRADNLLRIQSELVDYRVGNVQMKMMGAPLAMQGGTTPTTRARLLDHALCEPVTQDFGLGDVPSDLADRVSRLAEESLTHDLVSHPSGVDHDAPAVACPVEYMTEQEQLDYVDLAIEESRKNG